MARSLARVAGHGQAPCRGSWMLPGPAHRGDSRSRAQPLAAAPVGAVDLTANRGSAYRGGAARGSSANRPSTRRLPAAKGSRRLRRGSGDSAVRVREEG
ncbi:hypothetical protein BHM03_00060050 [Ensete ventricosum]|nr:hypothetical protein BHM03_00060050 [Ensete ventricosum]